MTMRGGTGVPSLWSLGKQPGAGGSASDRRGQDRQKEKRKGKGLRLDSQQSRDVKRPSRVQGGNSPGGAGCARAYEGGERKAAGHLFGCQFEAENLKPNFVRVKRSLWGGGRGTGMGGGKYACFIRGPLLYGETNS